MAAAVLMVAPTALAHWLEGQAGLFTLIATLLGLVAGMTYLILVTSSRRKDKAS